MAIVTVGIDLAKNVFAMEGVAVCVVQIDGLASVVPRGDVYRPPGNAIRKGFRHRMVLTRAV